jgi:hypothetical protein
VWVILRRLIPEALELVTTNADHWHPDFVMKLWITFHPQLASAPSQQVFIVPAKETEPCGSVRFEALFEAAPRGSLPSNLSQLGIGRRANKKPRPIIAGQGCVGSDTKLLCMRFCCRTGSTPRHPDTLSLFLYQYKVIPPSRAGHGIFTTKHFLFRLQIKGISTWRRSYAFSTMSRSMDIRNPTPRHPSKIEHYPGGQTLPTPKATDFKPGALLGSVSSELGLRKYLESNGRTLVVTADKNGPGSVFERELPDADVVISQPFWPAYLTADRIARTKKLKLAITAKHRLRSCRPSGRDRSSEIAVGLMMMHGGVMTSRAC